MVDDAFGNWLAGFLDGEGHFAIYPNGKSGAYATRASISLRLDDIQILREIQQRTGLGTILIQPHKNPGPHWEATWSVQSTVRLHSSVRRNRYHPSDWFRHGRAGD